MMKKSILIGSVILVAVLGVVFVAGALGLTDDPQESSVEINMNTILIGDQTGKISLVDTNSQEVLSQVDTGEVFAQGQAQERFLHPMVGTLSESMLQSEDNEEESEFFEALLLPTLRTVIHREPSEPDAEPEEQSDTEDATEEAEEAPEIPEEVPEPTPEPPPSDPRPEQPVDLHPLLGSRDATLVGEAHGYDLVEITIVSGDSWLALQSRLTPGAPEATILRLGREVQPNQELHPIYPGDKRLFFMEAGSFGDQPRGESPPTEEPVVEKEDQSGGAVEESRESYRADQNTSAKTVIEDDIEEVYVYEQRNPEHRRIAKSYIYRFNEEGFFVLDNDQGNLYRIDIVENEISLYYMAHFEDFKVADFSVRDMVIYFVTEENNALYILDRQNPRKLTTTTHIESWFVTENGVYCATNNAIFLVQPDLTIEKHLYLGDESTDIFTVDNSLFVANRFGSTSSKALVHRLRADMFSEGWIEVNYAQNTEFIGYNAEDQILYMKQDVHGQNSKLIIIDMDHRAGTEILLENSYKSLHYMSEHNYIYGVKDRVVHFYCADGYYLGSEPVGASALVILN